MQHRRYELSNCCIVISCDNYPMVLTVGNNYADCAARGLADDCVGSVKCRVGVNGKFTNASGMTTSWGDADAVPCPDRLDCQNMNLDFLVMAGIQRIGGALDRRGAGPMGTVCAPCRV